MIATRVPLVCPTCLAERRPQKTRYELAANWWKCLVHGPVMTGEFVEYELRDDELVGEWWSE